MDNAACGSSTVLLARNVLCDCLLFGEAMPEPMRVELSIVGGVLIVSSGISILGIKDCKTVNLLPSLLVPVAFYAIKGIIC